ncbi:MAG TPA: VOC family protein [Terracidiphilus sp.]|jgi:uncharacterized glyoxalase superfamily protein PhnB
MSRLARIAPELPVANIEDAVDYYERKLGFEVAMWMPENEYAIVERDGVAIHLFADGAQRSAVGVHIFTTELEQLFVELKESGAQITQTIEKKPWGNREFRVPDEFGNELKFTEPLAE